MAKRLWMAAGVILTLVLIGLTVADIYVSGQISVLLTETGSKVSALVEQWQVLQEERLSTAFFAGSFMIIILIVVLRIGGEKKTPKGISQSEALKIADELMAQYKKNGIYVTVVQKEGRREGS